jgi:5-formyltetrahydrofolate cyclo-ligase
LEIIEEKEKLDEASSLVYGNTMNKIEIRAQIAKKRPEFQALELLSKQIVEKFQGLELFQQAKTIGVYMPLPDEVDITHLSQRLEHRFFVPAFDATAGEYRMARFSNDWKTGKFGILEPADPIWAETEEMDLILVPGVAFDRHGNRLGRGGGFYDRLLPLYTATRVGICFDLQIVEKLPTEEHDCKMDALLTESKFLAVQ